MSDVSDKKIDVEYETGGLCRKNNPPDLGEISKRGVVRIPESPLELPVYAGWEEEGLVFELSRFHENFSRGISSLARCFRDIGDLNLDPFSEGTYEAASDLVELEDRIRMFHSGRIVYVNISRWYEWAMTLKVDLRVLGALTRLLIIDVGKQFSKTLAREIEREFNEKVGGYLHVIEEIGAAIGLEGDGNADAIWAEVFG